MPNHFIKLWKRGLALLLAGVLLFSNLSGSLAFAESTPSQETKTATSETAENGSGRSAERTGSGVCGRCCGNGS